jgi:LacI family transcriptional regulator
MTEIGLSRDLIVVADHRMEGGMNAFLELNKLRDRPTAVLCSNDMTAIGVLREAYEQNIKIPDELSVVGFDDIHLSQFTIPPLTTVQMSQHDLAKIAFHALLTEVEAGSLSNERRTYELTTSLVLRKSTALAPVDKSETEPDKTGRIKSRRTTTSSSR